jgi:hypothetical protein
MQKGLVGGALVLGSGGLLFARRSHAREALTSEMLNDALPTLAVGAARGLGSLPARARDEIKRYFHGKCLNVEGFVSHICSDEFRERLGRCRTPDEKEACFLQVFSSRVAREGEVLNWVETIATEIGDELDSEWAAYCTEVSLKWNTRVGEYGTSLRGDELSSRLGNLIRNDLRQAALLGKSGNHQPAVGETIDKVGRSAVLLLPLMRFGQAGLVVGVPVFFLLAAKHVWDYAMSQLEDRRGDYQAAISSRLALLGNRVGGEFEREVRQRISDLHTWQERSIRETATRLAEERVGLI